MTDVSRMSFLQQHVCEMWQVVCSEKGPHPPSHTRSTIMRNWIVLSAANNSEASFTYKSMTKDITTGNYYSSVVSVDRNC